MSDETKREAKRLELEAVSIDKALELFPHLDRAEARIIMVVLRALWPMLNTSQATGEHNDLKRLVGNHDVRRNEVKTNPIAEVKAYNPQNDPNW